MREFSVSNQCHARRVAYGHLAVSWKIPFARRITNEEVQPREFGRTCAKIIIAVSK